MTTQPQLNQVRERYLFLPPNVQGRLEKEASSNDFEVIQGLGQGAFGKVYKVRHKKTKNIYALKQIQKKQIKQQKMIQQIINEVKIMYKIDHPNIVKLFNHYEEEEYIYLILECATGGQLWHKLNQIGRFDEQTVKQFVREIISAIEYLHTKNPPIIHRDIKPENILVFYNFFQNTQQQLDKDGHIKLADFGWSNFFTNTKRQTYCGTLDYLAPEMILESGHDEKLDYWSLGVLIYELLTGKAPFTPPENIKDPREQQKLLEDNILKVKITFPSDFPTLAKSLIQGLLIKDPSKRFNITQMRDHPWLTSGQQPKIQQIQQQNQDQIKKDDIKEVVKDDKGQFSKEEIVDIANRQKANNPVEEEQVIPVDEDKSREPDPTKTTVYILNQKIQDLTNQLNEAKVFAQVKQEEVIQLQTQIQKSQPTVVSTAEQRRIRILEEDREKLKKDYDKLWEDIRVKESTITKLTLENRRIDDLQKQIDKLKLDKSTLCDKIKKLNDDLGVKQQELIEIKTQRESIIVRKDNKTSFFSNMGASIVNVMDDSFASNSSINELNTSFNEMKQKFQVGKDQIEEFDKAQRKIIQLESQLLQIKHTLDNQKDEIKMELQYQFEEEKEALEAALKGIYQVLDNYQEKIEQEQDERRLCKIKEVFENEKNEMKKKLALLEGLQNENQSLKKQIEYQNSIISDLKQEWELNKKIRQQNETKIKELEVMILDYQERMKQKSIR